MGRFDAAPPDFWLPPDANVGALVIRFGLGHARVAGQEIAMTGLRTMRVGADQPYAVWVNFEPHSSTITGVTAVGEVITIQAYPLVDFDDLFVGAFCPI